ncbi:hypothetical protein L873DRAFT_1707876 [Choiromyces venosus 120613-1]|uniref:Uncharacterized protein n=1 Tax=Choiromyces venosus 120613-1 TaxID=1336337 RepID=A0A3N4J3L1_9PEZI|nr:hypothetical protein L873DRAFT_1707876 [Choiromyces venosus 120613-1]
MAPRPYENKFRVRRSTPSSKPAVYAVPSGPHRGVHLLSNDPLPPSIQYMYRHPINVHKSLLTIDLTSTTTVPKRFDSIDAAQRYIDAVDEKGEVAEVEFEGDLLAEQLARGLSLGNASGNGACRRGRSEPVYRSLPESVRGSVTERERRVEVLDGMVGSTRHAGKVGKGGYSRSHTGVGERAGSSGARVESWRRGVEDRFAAMSICAGVAAGRDDMVDE